MLKNKHETTWRPDKIIAPSSMLEWQATSIKIVGKFSIPTFSKDAPELLEQDGQVRTPSDHLALLATFALRKPDFFTTEGLHPS